MPKSNKTLLEEANAAISRGDNEGFLSICSDIRNGRLLVTEDSRVKEPSADGWRRHSSPPRFTVKQFIAEGEFVTALGEITLEDEQGKAAVHLYCDVWRFRDSKIVELTAFVVKSQAG